MKVLEFETSKGKFVLVDNNQHDETVIDFLKKIDYGSYMNRIKLSEITEEQASEIVDDELYDYVLFRGHLQNYCETAIESLHSLLKSKGINLFENKAPLLHYTRLEQEQKTFYNPYIFKI